MSVISPRTGAGRFHCDFMAVPTPPLPPLERRCWTSSVYTQHTVAYQSYALEACDGLRALTLTVVLETDAAKNAHSGRMLDPDCI